MTKLRLMFTAMVVTGLFAFAGCGKDDKGGGGGGGDKFGGSAGLLAKAEDFAKRMCECGTQKCGFEVEAGSPHPFGHPAMDASEKLTPEDLATWKAARNKYATCAVDNAKRPPG